MTTNCLFCKIINGDIPAKILYHDDKVIAIEDIQPQAPTHVLIIPHEHIATLNDVTANHNELVGHLFQTAKKIAAEKGLSEPGYRVVMNCNSEGGQAVYHIHLHLLAGRQMSWPHG